jgi:hypothetical protein
MHRKPGEKPNEPTSDKERRTVSRRSMGARQQSGQRSQEHRELEHVQLPMIYGWSITPSHWSESTVNAWRPQGQR